MTTGLEMLPAGLRQLHGLGNALVRSAEDLAPNLRIVVTVPMLRPAGVVAALGAVSAALPCTSCPHRELAVGSRVAGWRSGFFTDDRLDALSDHEFAFGGLRVRGNHDTVHRLPDGFPERATTRLADGMRAQIADAHGWPEPLVGQRLSSSCAHPVVLAGQPTAVHEDVEALAAAAPALRTPGRLLPGHRLQDWFRHPVLAVGSLPSPDQQPWATAVHPRLTVINGTAGWATSHRHLWPATPMLILLSRRSPAACEAAASIATSAWPEPPAFPDTLAPWLVPGHGLEITCRVEPAADPDGEDLW
ncbi:hypothetical protein ACI8AF_00285 [Blastococcus sp. SYSU D00669]